LSSEWTLARAAGFLFFSGGRSSSVDWCFFLVAATGFLAAGSTAFSIGPSFLAGFLAAGRLATILSPSEPEVVASKLPWPTAGPSSSESSSVTFDVVAMLLVDLLVLALRVGVLDVLLGAGTGP
jgi:hypothetical protein